MKIAAFPKCFMEDICSGKMDLFDWFDHSVELEVEGLELYSGFLKSYKSKYLKKIRNSVEAYGMTIPMMCYSPDFTLKDSAARRKQVELQIDAINATAELGGRFCRTLSGQRRTDLSIEDGIEMVVECIKRCLDAAEKCNVRIVIENHYKDNFWEYPEFALKKEVFTKIVERIDSPWLGVQFDPSNAVVAGDDPIEVMEMIKNRIMTIHASDRYLVGGHKLEDLKHSNGEIGYSPYLIHGVTGEGANDYDEIFAILKEIQFNGWISIEDGLNGMDEMKRSVDYLKMMREKYRLFEK